MILFYLEQRDTNSWIFQADFDPQHLRTQRYGQAGNSVPTGVKGIRAVLL